jgi:hypothetical protein
MNLLIILIVAAIAAAIYHFRKVAVVSNALTKARAEGEYLLARVRSLEQTAETKAKAEIQSLHAKIDVLLDKSPAPTSVTLAGDPTQPVTSLAPAGGVQLTDGTTGTNGASSPEGVPSGAAPI